MKKVPFSVRFDPEALDLVKKLAAKKRLSQVQIVELAVRELAERENVKPSS